MVIRKERKLSYDFSQAFSGTLKKHHLRNQANDIEHFIEQEYGRLISAPLGVVPDDYPVGGPLQFLWWIHDVPQAAKNAPKPHQQRDMLDGDLFLMQGGEQSGNLAIYLDNHNLRPRQLWRLPFGETRIYRTSKQIPRLIGSVCTIDGCISLGEEVGIIDSGRPMFSLTERVTIQGYKEFRASPESKLYRFLGGTTFRSHSFSLLYSHDVDELLLTPADNLVQYATLKPLIEEIPHSILPVDKGFLSKAATTYLEINRLLSHHGIVLFQKEEEQKLNHLREAYG